MERFRRFFKKNRRLGLRIVKTGIAATVCVAISRLTPFDHPVVSVIAAVMSMGRSIDLSVRDGKNRMLGALIGSAAGCLFAAVSPGNAGLCGIGTILVLYLCHLFRLDDAGPLSIFTLVAVLFGAPQQSPWLYALACAGNALIGVAVAVAVNLAVMPPNYAEEIKKTFAELLRKTALAVENAGARRAVGIRSITECIDSLDAGVNLYVSEAKFLRWDDEEILSISSQIATCRLILDELKAVEVLGLSETAEPQGEILTVYRYHIGRMRELLERISDAPELSPPNHKS